jgi:hypothetical protein
MNTEAHDRIPERERPETFGRARPSMTSVDVQAMQKRARALRDEWIRAQVKTLSRVVRIAFRRLRRRATNGFALRDRALIKR